MSKSEKQISEMYGYVTEDTTPPEVHVSVKEVLAFEKIKLLKWTPFQIKPLSLNQKMEEHCCNDETNKYPKLFD